MCRIMEEMLEENAREVAEQVTKQVTKQINEEHARDLLSLGMLSDEQICKVTKLSLDRLKELKAQLH